MASLAELSLYIHIPFCVQRCHYCDFYSVAGSGAGELVERTFETLLHSLDKQLERLNPGRISTVFIGGGTPSHVSDEILFSFLNDLRRRIGDPDEFSIEANPESLDAEFLDIVNSSAVNRISMGVQTYDDALLHWLGRPAGRDAVDSADALLASSWKGRLSRDLLAALPRKEGGLRADLELALAGNPGHLSLYELTVESGTALAGNREKIDALPGDDTSWREWEAALIFLERAGYKRYEVSNFALPGDESLHNLAYWRMKDSLGIGPGAASTFGFSDGKVIRRQERRDLLRWLEDPHDSAEEIILSSEELALEYFMMGLRTAEGLSREQFLSVFGLDPVEPVRKAAEKWAKSGHLLINKVSIAPSSFGMDFVDSMLRDFAVELDGFPAVE